jgi:hypothetical protein
MIWEKNYLEELRDFIWEGWDSIGGGSIVGCCDGGFILFHPDPPDVTVFSGGNPIPFLWRIDKHGEVIWATWLKNLSNNKWWRIDPDSSQRPCYLPVELYKRFTERGSISSGYNGTFVFTGNLAISESNYEPYIFEIQDPDLINVNCPPDCQRLFPQLWNKVDDKFPLAKTLIDAAKRKGTDTTIIQLMEQELANAENAQKICDLESAAMHLDWIIQAAPEPYILTALLLMPLFWAWKRTGFWYN